MTKSILSILAVGFGVGCGVDAPTAPKPVAPAFAVAEQSGCYVVSGDIVQTATPPSLSGTISGDVVGTVSTQLDASRAAGPVYLQAAEQTWHVSGGNVPELIGRTVRLVVSTEVVFAQPPLAQVNTTATAVEGVASGRLTYHGILDTSSPPPFPVEVTYNGVICP